MRRSASCWGSSPSRRSRRWWHGCKLAGYIDSTPDKRLAPTRRFFERPLAESPVHAGMPNPVEDAPADALTIDDYLIERPSQTVLIRVKGDSMMDAGILDGDLVVVEKTAAAKRGDIVVAIVDGQFTLKTLDLERGTVHPQAREQGIPDHPARGRSRDLRRDGRPRAQALARRGDRARAAGRQMP